MLTVTIIGPGRVGGALAISLPSDRYSVETVVSDYERAPGWLGSLANVSRTCPLLELEAVTSDIVFITTQDQHISAVATALGPKISTSGSTYIYHTSGSYSSKILDGIESTNAVKGSIHPLVSISKPELGPERFRNSFFCVEGTSAAVDMGVSIVNDLGGSPFTIDTKFKTLYHAAAVTACGHLVALFDAAVEMMTHCGLSSEESKRILLPLVNSTVGNLNVQSTAEALTGTFARADLETLTRHLTALNENVSDDLLEIYLLLGERSLELAAKQGISSDRIERMRAKVSIAKSKLKW